jgi:hypothetical protein
MKQPVLDSLEMQPINECPLRLPEPSLAHSKGKPDVSSMKTNINVRFATSLIEEVPIRVIAYDMQWQERAQPVGDEELQPTTRFQVVVGGIPSGV